MNDRSLSKAELKQIGVVLSRAREVCESFQFNFTIVLDDSGRCLPHTNATQLHQLERAMIELSRLYEEEEAKCRT